MRRWGSCISSRRARKSRIRHRPSRPLKPTHNSSLAPASPDNCLHDYNWIAFIDTPTGRLLNSEFMIRLSRTLVFICLIGSAAAADVTNNSASSDRKFRPWSDLSDKDKAKMSADAVSQMRKMLKEMFQKLEEARKRKDIEKLNCVNADVATSKALVDFAERADLQLQEVAARGEKKQSAEDEWN